MPSASVEARIEKHILSTLDESRKSEDPQLQVSTVERSQEECITASKARMA